MNRSGKEYAQLNKLEEYLNKLGMFENRNLYPNSDFSIAAVRDLKYVDLWQIHVKSHWYDFRLKDNSLLYFYKEGPKVSMSYLGCPYDCITLDEFKEDYEADAETDIEELYEEYLSTANIKSNPNYFRYDLEISSYREGEHPVAHIHCGLMNSVRIGVGKELDYMAFSAFVLRQVFVDKWNIVLNNKNDYHELYVHKTNLSDIAPQYYQPKDKEQDFYLF